MDYTKLKRSGSTTEKLLIEMIEETKQTNVILRSIALILTDNPGEKRERRGFFSKLFGRD